MTLPGNVDSGYVTGTFMDAAGNNATGTITFTPAPTELFDPGATPPTTILPQPVTATLVAGTFLQQLTATDDPDLNPTGWTYQVTFALKILGQPVAIAPFSIFVPQGPSNAPVDLTLVTPVPGTGGSIPVIVDTNVLGEAEAYTDTVENAHEAATDPHPQYVRVLDAATGTVVDVQILRAFEADPMPANVPGAYLLKGGF